MLGMIHKKSNRLLKNFFKAGLYRRTETAITNFAKDYLLFKRSNGIWKSRFSNALNWQKKKQGISQTVSNKSKKVKDMSRVVEEMRSQERLETKYELVVSLWEDGIHEIPKWGLSAAGHHSDVLFLTERIWGRRFP